MYTVYMHITPSKKIYIGVTARNVKERWRNGKGYFHNKHFFNAIQKYGWDNIEHKILFENLTQEEAYAKEIELIKKYKSNNNMFGYNLSSGGEKSAFGTKWSEETRQKHFENIKNGGRKHTEEEKEKIKKSVIRHYDLVGRKTKKEKDEFIRNEKRKKKIICVENGMVFYGAEQAAKWVNIKNKQLIYRVLNKYGYNKTAGGYHWEYVKRGDI